jgi:hypothetical protein
MIGEPERTNGGRLVGKRGSILVGKAWRVWCK